MKEYKDIEIRELALKCESVTEDFGMHGFEEGFKKAMELYKESDCISNVSDCFSTDKVEDAFNKGLHTNPVTMTTCDEFNIDDYR